MRTGMISAERFNVLSEGFIPCGLDGRFWHVCPKHSNMPRNNRPFWKKKLGQNKDRDKFVARELRKTGWKVVRVWEHELKKPAKIVPKIKKYIE